MRGPEAALRRARRGLVVLLTGVIAALVGAGTALASWSGTISRGPGNTLVAKLTASSPSYGLNLGLSKPGFKVSGVKADVNGLGGPACTPTGQSVATTRNSGVDCSFAGKESAVTITFTTSPRYPDGGGAAVRDQQGANALTQLAGPGGGKTTVPNFDQLKKDLKLEAASRGHVDYEIMFTRCRTEQLKDLELANQYVHTPLAPFAYAIIANTDRADCEWLAEGALHEAAIKVDPVDQHFSAVALPSTVSRFGFGAPCGKATGRTRAVCNRLAALAARQVSALARSAAVWAAVDTTLNRLNTANTDGSGVGVETQSAALMAYDGEVADAARAVDAADLALARELRSLHLDVTVTAKQIAQDAQAVSVGKPPAALAQALAAQRIGSSAFVAAVKGLGVRKGGSLSLVAQLSTVQAKGPEFARLTADQRKLTGQDLVVLVNGLQIAGAIDRSTAHLLGGEATAVQNAAAGAARSRAAQTFVRDAAQAHGGAATLLETAGRVLL